MPATNEGKGKKKGFFALLKESIFKVNEGCGPGCSCHTADEKKKADGLATGKDGKKA